MERQTLGPTEECGDAWTGNDPQFDDKYQWPLMLCPGCRYELVSGTVECLFCGCTIFYASTTEEREAHDRDFFAYLEKKKEEEEAGAKEIVSIDAELGQQREIIIMQQREVFGKFHTRSNHSELRRKAQKVRKHRWKWMQNDAEGDSYRREKAAMVTRGLVVLSVEQRIGSQKILGRYLQIRLSLERLKSFNFS